MTSPVKPWKMLIIGLILIALIFFTWTFYQFDQIARQSERHTYSYSIDLSYDTTIDNVTFFLPVPERNNYSAFHRIPVERDCIWGIFGLEPYDRLRKWNPHARNKGCTDGP